MRYFLGFIYIFLTNQFFRQSMETMLILLTIRYEYDIIFQEVILWKYVQERLFSHHQAELQRKILSAAKYLCQQHG